MGWTCLRGQAAIVTRAGLLCAGRRYRKWVLTFLGSHNHKNATERKVVFVTDIVSVWTCSAWSYYEVEQMADCPIPCTLGSNSNGERTRLSCRWMTASEGADVVCSSKPFQTRTATTWKPNLDHRRFATAYRAFLKTGCKLMQTAVVDDFCNWNVALMTMQ